MSWQLLDGLPWHLVQMFIMRENNTVKFNLFFQLNQLIKLVNYNKMDRLLKKWCTNNLRMTFSQTFSWSVWLNLNCAIAETLLRPTAEEDGGSWFHSPRCVAEFHAGLEVWLPGQHEWWRLHSGCCVCHRTRRPGSVADTLDYTEIQLSGAQKTLYFNCMLCFPGNSAGAPRERVWRQSGDCRCFRGCQENCATEIRCFWYWI